MTHTVFCRKYQQDLEGLEKPPFPGPKGQDIYDNVSRQAWQEWLQHQTLLINHYGLDPREKKSRDFLYSQIDEVLLGDGEAKQVDTSKEGTIDW